MHTLEQLDFLRSSAGAYDAGKEHEAKRLAAVIRTVAHDTRHSRSLLTQLGVRDRLPFIDRGPPLPPTFRATYISFGLTVVQMTFGSYGEVYYIPAFDRPNPERLHPPVAFTDWWNRTVLDDRQGGLFSRKALVLALANKEGGAHIDTALEESYRALTRENSLGFTQGEDERPISNSIVCASVRHVAAELIHTLENGLRWIGDRPEVVVPICSLPHDFSTSTGRNDPCPCDSTLKFKHCFLQRRPLVRVTTPTESSEPVPVAAVVEPVEDPMPPSMQLDGLLLLPVDSARHAA